ncbi:uncharacterized protein LOC124121790 [Haliotis rufescens]|uniref:uncharacterized protein LOC124121790 n=1 Tax=Haliotis rufescens TaxID=6454 RepID=UPI00201F7484|nr:uncharacterized protein LOC124121790 [Haliotis rufescens]XP_046340828.2 uncharacterized protein LOC124121790 [Haliotis rufescens]XP_046340835.2 uncharacterized protein LOC124121790 [Haliotis rufescens]
MTTCINMISTRGVSVLFVMCLIYVHTCRGNIYHQPVMATPGSVKIVCLLDLHRTTSDTEHNICNTPNPYVLQMAFVSLWKLDKMIKQTGSQAVGISVYDTCGSKERAVRILSSAISDSVKLGGVITYTSPGVTSAVNGILRHLNVLNIDITDDVMSCREDSSCVSMSIASRAKSEAVLELTRHLNWTYVTTFSLPNTRALAEERLFADMISIDKACLSGRHVVSNVQDITSAVSRSTSNGIVVFTGDATLDGVFTLTLERPKTAILVSKELLSSRHDQDSYIEVTNEPVNLEGFDNYLKTFTENTTLQWIRDTSYFQGTCLVAGSDVTAMISSCIKSESSAGALAMSDAVGVISGALATAVNMSCSQYDVLTCPALSMAVTPVTLRQRARYTQRSGEHEHLLVEQNTRVIIASTSPWPVNLTEVQTKHGRLQLPLSLPEMFYNSHCHGFCSECVKCKPLITSNERVVVEEGTLYIVGVFPIHKSTSGVACADPNIPGFRAAQAFTAAVGQINSTGLTKDLPAGVSIGWVMFDSCGDTTWFERKHHEIDTCLYKYKDANEKDVIVQPARTIAYINLGGNRNPPTSSPTAIVSNYGIGMNGEAAQYYIEAVISTLLKVKWTYVSLIHSNDDHSSNMLDLLNQKLPQTPICFDRVYNISKAVPASSAMRKATADTETVILLTNTTDTEIILASLSPSGRKYRLVMFTWNVGVLSGMNLSSVVEETLVVWPKSVTSSLDDVMDMSGNPWFEGFQGSTNISSSSKFFAAQEMAESSLIFDAVNALARQINSAYTMLCPSRDGLCDAFADFENVKSHIQSQENAIRAQYEISVQRFLIDGTIVSKKIGTVGTDGDAKLILDGTAVLPHTSECEGWCPRCQRCQGEPSPTNRSLYLPGDVIVAGVLPLRNSDKGGLQCGGLSTSVESEQVVEAFMFAVETFPRRYPYLLPNVKVGGLVIDSCSDANTAVQKVVNFETCTTTFNTNADAPPHPSQTLGYLLHGSQGDVQQLEQCVSAVDKLAVATVSDWGQSSTNTKSYLTIDYEARSEVSAIVQTLTFLNWTQVVLIISDKDVFRLKSDLLLSQTAAKSICVSKLVRFNGTILSSLQYATSQLTLTGFVPIVVMASKEDTVRLFQEGSIKRVPRTWLISTSAADWSVLSDLNVPTGTLLLDRNGKQSPAFADFYSNMMVRQNASAWWQQYWEDKSRCSLTDTSPFLQPCSTSSDERPIPSQLATRIILGVDVILHAVHNQYVTLCDQKKGFCRRFADEGVGRVPASAKAVAFEFEDEIVKFAESGKLVSSYSLLSVHPRGRVKVGEWRSGQLLLDASKLYYIDGQSSANVAHCHSKCICLNNVTSNRNITPADAVFYETSGRFNGELWATIIVTISAAGAFVTLILIFYVIYKVCAGALAKRYVGLGLLLLIGVLILYLAVLPFVFTPSNTVCGLRFFAPGFTYCLCFATVLVKMTSIRDYKLIGLGGEVSNLNQFLSVFFVTSVQIAIGVQYWVLKAPFVTEKSTGSQTFYACAFQRSEFLVYLVYVMFVLVLSSIYGIGVRKEQKNMGEARLLLTSSWLCVFVWVGWTVVLMVLDVTLIEPVISAGIMACATLMLTVIFIPKIHMVARLKYDVSKQTTSMQNGYKVDPDFMFERPYSLPGTLTSSYSSVKTYPKSIEHFDSSLSY